MRKIYSTIGDILILILAATALFILNSYKRGNIAEETGGCVDYYEKCNCLGIVSVSTGFPAQYRCAGFESCKTISGIECKGGMK